MNIEKLKQDIKKINKESYVRNVLILNIKNIDNIKDMIKFNYNYEHIIAKTFLLNKRKTAIFIGTIGLLDVFTIYDFTIDYSIIDIKDLLTFFQIENKNLKKYT